MTYPTITSSAVTELWEEHHICMDGFTTHSLLPTVRVYRDDKAGRWRWARTSLRQVVWCQISEQSGFFSSGIAGLIPWRTCVARYPRKYKTSMPCGCGTLAAESPERPDDPACDSGNSPGQLWSLCKGSNIAEVLPYDQTSSVDGLQFVRIHTIEVVEAVWENLVLIHETTFSCPLN
jgi:hypothetical protein